MASILASVKGGVRKMGKCPVSDVNYGDGVVFKAEAEAPAAWCEGWATMTTVKPGHTAENLDMYCIL